MILIICVILAVLTAVAVMRDTYEYTSVNTSNHLSIPTWFIGSVFCGLIFPITLLIYIIKFFSSVGVISTTSGRR